MAAKKDTLIHSDTSSVKLIPTELTAKWFEEMFASKAPPFAGFSYQQSSPVDSQNRNVYDRTKESHGGDGMDKYVTKSEFEIQNQLFSSKIENLEDKISSKLDMQNQIIANNFDHIESKIGDISSDIEKSIRLALYEKEEQNRKDRKETNRYIFGTLLIGTIGIIIGVIGLLK